MKKLTGHRMLAAAAVAAVAVAGGTGAAIAAGGGSGQTPQQRQAAILQDLAGKLGVSVDTLKTALKGVAEDQLQQAVTDGRLTQAQADALKQKLESGTFPAFPFGMGFGHHGGMLGHGDELATVATYLGLTQAQLVTQLQSGKTLAQVATAQGKTVAGLEQAMLDALKTKLDAAVAAKRITAATETSILARAKTRIDAMVNGTMPAGPRLRFGAPGMGWGGMAGMHQQMHSGWSG